jgi:hypothetical protein
MYFPFKETDECSLHFTSLKLLLLLLLLLPQSKYVVMFILTIHSEMGLMNPLDMRSDSLDGDQSVASSLPTQSNASIRSLR